VGESSTCTAFFEQKFAVLNSGMIESNPVQGLNPGLFFKLTFSLASKQINT